LYWLAKQKWVDGNIGMWGVSYLALVQWAAAFDYPPELKTMVPISMGTDFHKTLFEQGAFRHFVTYWMMLIPDSEPDTDNVEEENFLDAVRHMPHTEVDKEFTENELDWYREWIASSSLEAPIWSREDAQQLAQVAENMEIPVLLLDGWYDPFFGAQFQDYLDLGSREKSVMVIGPWNHLQMPAGDLLPEETPGATEVSMQMGLEWFDYYLKNNSDNKPKEGYIKVYDVGSNEWQSYDQWPPAYKTINFYLSEFSKSPNCDGGVLSLSEGVSEGRAEQVSYTFDPNNPVMSRGGSSFLMPLNEQMGPGALLQKGLCEREDILTFISEPLGEDMTIAGEMQAVLSVASDAEDTMFTAKLIDVFPDGSAVNIRDSATTLRMRNNAGSELDYSVGEIVEVAIKMWTTHWTLKKDHRLRLDVSSSNFPAFNLHSNYAGPWEKQTERKIARQSVYAPSYLKLPIRIEKERAHAGK
jgi:putative CocE/NonD family hydrolase